MVSSSIEGIGEPVRNGDTYCRSLSGLNDENRDIKYGGVEGFGYNDRWFELVRNKFSPEVIDAILGEANVRVAPGIQEAKTRSCTGYGNSKRDVLISVDCPSSLDERCSGACFRSLLERALDEQSTNDETTKTQPKHAKDAEPEATDTTTLVPKHAKPEELAQNTSSQNITTQETTEYGKLCNGFGPGIKFGRELP